MAEHHPLQIPGPEPSVWEDPGPWWGCRLPGCHCGKRDSNPCMRRMRRRCSTVELFPHVPLSRSAAWGDATPSTENWEERKKVPPMQGVVQLRGLEPLTSAPCGVVLYQLSYRCVYPGKARNCHVQEGVGFKVEAAALIQIYHAGVACLLIKRRKPLQDAGPAIGSLFGPGWLSARSTGPMVEIGGLEPPASSLQRRRSTS